MASGIQSHYYLYHLYPLQFLFFISLHFPYPLSTFHTLSFKWKCQIAHDRVQPYICSNTHPTSNLPRGCDEKVNARVSCLFIIHVNHSRHHLGILFRSTTASLLVPDFIFQNTTWMTCHSAIDQGEYLPYQNLVVETLTDLPEARRQQELAIPICGIQKCKDHYIWWATQLSGPMLAYLLCLNPSLANTATETRSLQIQCRMKDPGTDATDKQSTLLRTYFPRCRNKEQCQNDFIISEVGDVMVNSARSYTRHYGVLTDSKKPWGKIERINHRTQFNADNMKGGPKITLETYREIEAAHSQPRFVSNRDRCKLVPWNLFALTRHTAKYTLRHLKTS